MNFKDRYGPWALIVGGSAGIGGAAAEEAARRGLHVITVARRQGLLEERAAGLRKKYGVKVLPLSVDLAAPGAAETIVEGVEEREVGTMVYNAAAEPRGSFLDVPLSEHLDNITVNCTVPTVLVHHFGQGLAERRRGAIVLVSSMGAFQGAKVFSSYFAAKAYEWILAEGLWSELREVGVDAFSYIVGATRTETYQGQADGSSDVDAAPLGTDVAPSSGAPPSGDSSRWRLQNPSDPGEVGRGIFEAFGGGPTEFSHPFDQETSSFALQPNRRAAVERMSALISGIRH
jgi:uncharacterized protein